MKNLFKNQTFQEIKILGQGTYGKCFLVRHVAQNQLYVLKKIDVRGMNDRKIQETIKQAKILEALDHPNIIKFIQAYIQDEYLNIVMEYADGGDLSAKIKHAKGSYYSENQILNWFTQICLAIKHVHDRKIIHRDLKSQNIFLTSKGIVKLGDFGIAKPLQKTLQKNKTVVGTPYYMSPEICQQKQYTLKADIWSLGAILFEMCALKPPFDAKNLTALALKITSGIYEKVPEHYSDELKRMIAALLVVNPSERPTINQVLKNSLLKKRIDYFLPQSIRQRQFSHTTLHSQILFEKKDSKKQVSKKSDQDVQSVISPRNLINQNAFFSAQNSQSKSNANLNKIRDPGAKDKNLMQKKKKSDRKRQISEPGMTPKSNEKKIKSNKSLTNLDKKKQKNNFFKKKRLPEDYQNQLSQIRQLKDCVVQMHEHLSSDRQREQKRKELPSVLTNNFIKEEEQQFEEEQDFYSDSQEIESEDFLKEATFSKKNNELSVNLQKMLLEIIGEKELSRSYYEIQQNHGIILENKDTRQEPGQNRKTFSNQGLVSLLYGINNFLTA